MNMILLSFDVRQEFEEKVFLLRTLLHIYIYIHNHACIIITQEIYMSFTIYQTKSLYNLRYIKEIIHLLNFALSWVMVELSLRGVLEHHGPQTTSRKHVVDLVIIPKPHFHLSMTFSF